MSATDPKLVDLAVRTTNAVREAAQWLDRNRDIAGAQYSAVRRDMRSFEVSARRLERAAKRPMCVGVFGASQVGKSYLLSGVSRKGTGALMALFKGIELDFLKEINPESKKEATGLVTRFTVRPSEAPESHPVAVRLLSQTDIVKIIANTFFLDFSAANEKAPEATDVIRALDEAEKKVGAAAGDGLSDLDIDDLRRYFETQQFKHFATIKVLRDTEYWRRLEEIAPRIGIQERIKLYGFLWGRLPIFTTVYRELYDALAGLGFADEAFCTIDSLRPREISIINVETLNGLGKSSEDKLDVIGRGGRHSALSRAQLAAIIAELNVQIKEQPWDFFKHTDLLDFPGARSRYQFDDAETKTAEQGMLAELFLRGKVAYLFDRYCAEHELTSMLLCIAPGNQEVKTLPGMVLDWVHSSHGKSPEARAAMETALFIVLTKFDLLFAESKGEAEASDRWAAAMHTAITGNFNSSRDRWAEEWTPGQPFNNTYWLRNPNAINRGLMTFDDRTETGILDTSRVAKFKGEYMATEAVRKHFADPERAWEEAFRLNDGGISFLVQSLGPVCRPELKQRQIRAQLADLRQSLHRRLNEFYISDDDTEAEKRVEQARKSTQALLPTIKSQHFGHLLAELQLGQDELQYVFRNLMHKGGSILGGGSEIAIPIPGQEDWSQSQRGAGGRHAALARAALEHWAGRLRSLSSDGSAAPGFLNVDAVTLENLTREILDGSGRVELGARLEKLLYEIMPAVDMNPSAMLKPALASSMVINEFVWSLGQDGLAPEERAAWPDRDGHKHAVFAQRQRADTLTNLPERSHAFSQSFIRDWLYSFVHLAEKNARQTQRRKYNVEENARLGALLQEAAVQA